MTECLECNHHLFSINGDQNRVCLNVKCSRYGIELTRIQDIIDQNSEPDYGYDDWVYEDGW